MYNHIIPRVLLKQFLETPDSKIKWIDKDFKKHQSHIKRTGGKEGFYSDQKEKDLGVYETKFGKIIKLIMEQAPHKDVKLKFDDYISLLEFFTIQWRRTPYGIESKKNQVVDISMKAIDYIQSKGAKMKPGYSKEWAKREINKTLDKMQESSIDIYEGEYTSVTGVIQKTLNYYSPQILYNKTNIDFCLHDKIFTTLTNINDIDDQYPERLIYPLNKKVLLILEYTYPKKIKYSGTIIIPRFGVFKDEETEKILSNYILGSSKAIYYVNREDIILKWYKIKKNFVKKTGINRF